ncbi:hypothetical protein D3C87_2019750 [compost metagenome]
MEAATDGFLGRSHGHRKLADRDAEIEHLDDFLGAVVIMRSKRQAMLFRQRDDFLQSRLDFRVAAHLDALVDHLLRGL